MSAHRTTSRVIVSVTSRREAETTLALVGVLCQATHRELVCRYAGETRALDARRLPISNMLDFAGERLDIGMEALAAAMRRDSAACRDLVRSMAETLRIGWHFAGEGWEGGLDPQPERGDIVVVGTPDGRLTPADLRKALERLPAGGGLLIARQRPRPAHNAMVLLVVADAARPQSERIAEGLASLGKSQVTRARLAQLPAASMPRPAIALLSESEARNASETELAALLNLRSTILVVSEAA